MNPLPLSYYQHHDVIFLSQDLLGKFLMTQIGTTLTGGMIIETEAYRAPEDRASHAFNNRRTKRNEMMFQQGGYGYVYQCYGIHALFNIVTNLSGIPHAILIRAIQPTVGIEEMLKRRNQEKLSKTTAGGPGTLTQALGINLSHNGCLLTEPPIWIEDHGIIVKPDDIIAGPRVGVDYAGEHALLPWRFRIKP
jgi:DNA-3-methyladenine glycosylase